jgi:hypothetical protein
MMKVEFARSSPRIARPRRTRNAWRDSATLVESWQEQITISSFGADPNEGYGEAVGTTQFQSGLAATPRQFESLEQMFRLSGQFEWTDGCYDDRSGRKRLRR